MRIALPLAALMGAILVGAPAPAQTPTPDPLADSITRGLTRGLRVDGTTPQPPVTPVDPRSPVQPATTGAGERPGVSLMVTFATGSAALTPQAEAILASLARAFAAPELAGARFRIEGHTDTVGDPAMNQALSELRAAAVRDHLVQRHGIAPERLETIGFGESRPLVRTGDERPEIRNRRVQVINLGG